MERNTIKDIIYTFITKLFYLFGSFMISIMLARLLGPEGKGLVAALFVVPNVLTSLADLGIRQSSAYAIGRKEHSVQDVFSSSLLLWMISSIISVGILLVYFTFFSPYEFGIPLVAIALAYIPVKIIDAYYYGIHQGLQQIEIMNMRHVLAFVARLIWIILFVWIIRGGEIGAASAMLASLVIVGLYSFIKMKDKLSFKIKYIPKLPQKLLKKGIVFALALFILNLNYRIDVILLTPFVPSSDIGIYTTGSSLAELIWQLPSAMAIVMFSSSANKKDDKEALMESIRILRVSLVTVTIGSILFALTSHWIVPLLYGQEFIESATVINLLLPGVVIIIIVQILHATLSGRGYPLVGFPMLVIAILINVVLNLVLIPTYGIYGAAVASTISYVFGGIGFAYSFSKKTNIKMRDFLIMKKEDVHYLTNKIKMKINR